MPFCKMSLVGICGPPGAGGQTQMTPKRKMLDHNRLRMLQPPCTVGMRLAKISRRIGS